MRGAAHDTGLPGFYVRNRRFVGKAVGLVRQQSRGTDPAIRDQLTVDPGYIRVGDYFLAFRSCTSLMTASVMLRGHASYWRNSIENWPRPEVIVRKSPM